MRRRQLLTGSLALTAACRRQERKTVAVIPKGTSHVFWLAVRAGAEAAGRQFGLNIVWNGPPTETDYTRQVQIMDSMVARHVDGIALAAAERTALVPPLERAVQAGIPVTVFDSGLDSKNYVSFVATDNYEGGRTAARELSQRVGGHGTVAMVMHAPGSVSTMDRERGFRDELKEHSGVRLVAEQFGMSDRAKSRAVAENLLSAHPGLGGLFASSEPSSVGTALAVRSRRLSGQTKLVAFDSSQSLVDELREGTISALIVQDPRRMGFEAVTTLAQKLDGRTPPPRIDLHAQVVTRDDLSSPAVHKLLGIK